MEYIEGEKDEGCIFCEKPAAGDDEGNYIVHRGTTAFVILNKYPYVSGHLMVSPFRHVGRPKDLEMAERTELMNLVTLATEVLEDAVNPGGLNVGANIGRAAGAGVEDHLHFHVLPRWERDTNFMPMVADTRVLPEGLAKTYERLKPFFDGKS
ncbi:MAG: HIT domain-containing protein [Terriglobia bacterium]